MNAAKDTIKQTLLENITQRVSKEVGEPSANLIIRFIEQFYQTVAEEDLVARDVNDLYGALMAQWRFIYQRRPGETKIDVVNPTYELDGWQSAHSVVQISHDDMPFLVDSVRMEINRHGLNVHLIVNYGGMRLRRDEQGRITEVLAMSTAVDDNLALEAPMYLEIDRITDEQALSDLLGDLQRVLLDVRHSVEDWQAMRARVQQALAELDVAVNDLDQDEVRESRDFLNWIANDHFTFLGCRDYFISDEGAEKYLVEEAGSGLGVLRHAVIGTVKKNKLTPEAKELLSSPQILLLSKTNTRATVHRPVYTDYIGIKRFDKTGKVIGELRIVGLYTSMTYNSNPMNIPFLRRKVAYVMQNSGLTKGSHASKALLNILETFPRDDLFQARADELLSIAVGILNIQERPCVRLFMRKDIHGRFISCFIYVPRERFTTQLRKLFQNILHQAFNATEITFVAHFSDSILARIHYMVKVDSGHSLEIDAKRLELKLIEVSRVWADDLRDALVEQFGEEQANTYYQSYFESFRSGYREDFSARSAVLDIIHMEQLSDENMLEMRFYRPLNMSEGCFQFKLFHLEHTIPLSDVVPIIENMGLRIISERPYKIIRKDGQVVWINDFNVEHGECGDLDLNEVKDIFRDAFKQVWFGEMENDGLNRLVLVSQLPWREVSMIRAYTKYMRQIGSTFSQKYVEETLARNAVIVRLIVQLFKQRLDPELERDDDIAQALVQKIIEELDFVAILDEDRILRRFMAVVKACLRTNYFQQDKNGRHKTYIAFKIDSRAIPEMPQPLPMFEIFVYSPRFEGIHLRSAKVARGGLRWSDRREDFRTEVLGLMKAQMVKNAVIVPSGAKGGFVTKCLPEEGSRDVIMAEVIDCYQNFIRGLLDITDNYENKQVVHPSQVRRYDEDDPYLVVAADKGTATFSDIANGIARDYGFWLDDAFASGGSTGYDHKKMGITARGAWVSVERHFRELGLNTQTTDFSVVGVGDMAGDVFGNGMLLSKHIKLVAAFNHMHIFIDPDPDPSASFEERLRLFQLPRSAWTDYDQSLISEGGGVFERSAKSISLSKQTQQLLGVQHSAMVPNELISSILKAPVDLLWNGGIGTYVKSSQETNDAVGDRSNDNLRVNGCDLRCRVVGEGGNLGLTQLGRVEFASNKGKINTDAIDNSAGVDCSDHEVNIKILLNDIVNGDMTEKQRNQLLAEMTDDVGSLVLHNNYLQTLSLSIADSRSTSYLDLFSRYMHIQENEGLLDRDIEFLPSDKELLTRKAENKSLTRPEISVLIAYSKSIIKEHILDSNLPEDPYLARVIARAFPHVLRERFASAIDHHQLRRDIIATQLSNIVVNEVGVNFVDRLNDETGAPISAIMRAYGVVRELFQLVDLWRQIQSLDYQVGAQVQHKMVIETIRLARRATRWFLRNNRSLFEIETMLSTFLEPLQNLSDQIVSLAQGAEAENYQRTLQHYLEQNVPQPVACRIAKMRLLFTALDIIQAANQYKLDTLLVAKVYFALGDSLELGWLREQITSFNIDDRWDALMREALRDDLDWQQRALTIAVLQFQTDMTDIEDVIQKWSSQHQGLVERWQLMLKSLRAHPAPSFTIYAVAVREVFDLAQTSFHYAAEKKSD